MHARVVASESWQELEWSDGQGDRGTADVQPSMVSRPRYTSRCCSEKFAWFIPQVLRDKARVTKRKQVITHQPVRPNRLCQPSPP